MAATGAVGAVVVAVGEAAVEVGSAVAEAEIRAVAGRRSRPFSQIPCPANSREKQLFLTEKLRTV